MEEMIMSDRQVKDCVEIEWKMSIEYPGAKKGGAIQIHKEDVVGMGKEQVENYIYEQIWEDAIKYVYAHPTEDLDEVIEELFEGNDNNE